MCYLFCSHVRLHVPVAARLAKLRARALAKPLGTAPRLPACRAARLDAPVARRLDRAAAGCRARAGAGPRAGCAGAYRARRAQPGLPAGGRVGRRIGPGWAHPGGVPGGARRPATRRTVRRAGELAARLARTPAVPQRAAGQPGRPVLQSRAGAAVRTGLGLAVRRLRQARPYQCRQRVGRLAPRPCAAAGVVPRQPHGAGSNEPTNTDNKEDAPW